MHKDGQHSGTEMTDLHLRCDPVTGKAHALVMAKDGYTLQDTKDAWIKVDGHVVANKYSRDFAWVIKDGKRIGYECSFDYDYSRDHVIRAKAKFHRHYFSHYGWSDGGLGPVDPGHRPAGPDAQRLPAHRHHRRFLCPLRRHQ